MPELLTELYNPVTGMRLRETSDPTAGPDAELVWEATYPPHAPEPDPHLHPFQAERMEILAGAPAVRMNGILRTLSPGDVVDIPAGTPHGLWNPADEPARTIWRTMPARHRRELFAKLYGLASEGKTNAEGMPNLLQVAVLQSAYPDEIRFVRPPLVVQRIVFAVLAPIGRMLGYKAT